MYIGFLSTAFIRNCYCIKDGLSLKIKNTYSPVLHSQTELMKLCPCGRYRQVNSVLHCLPLGLNSCSIHNKQPLNWPCIECLMSWVVYQYSCVFLVRGDTESAKCVIILLQMGRNSQIPTEQENIWNRHLKKFYAICYGKYVGIWLWTFDLCFVCGLHCSTLHTLYSSICPVVC